MSKMITAILIGAGDRGKDTYGEYAHRYPDKIKFVAVAEPKKDRRDSFAKTHNIPKEQVFESWEPLLKKDKFADSAFITTQDKLHFEPAIQAMKKGYDVLLEKPMATSLEECKKLVETAEKTGRLLQICHVLRYAPFFSTIKSIIKSGQIGEIVNISLRENVSHFHYAHSYVRGHWHNREKSSPMILAKSCHDMDIFYWLINSPAKLISSFGSQKFFTEDNAPKNAPDFCLEGCPIEDTCLYNAKRIYLEIKPLLHIAKSASKGWTKFIIKMVLKYPNLTKYPPFNKVTKYSGWPISTITSDTSMEGRIKALTETNYGRCVYKITDHDVVDHQVVNIVFENDTTATFTMHGFSHEEGRTIRIDGTKATIIGEFLHSGNTITVYNPLDGTSEIWKEEMLEEGHGGGDELIIEDFISNVQSKDRKQVLTNARDSLESHLMAFAADISRIEERNVNMKEVR